ncbi:MAG: LamG domain-containing protein, partial [Candidatus Pacebacteria bacterium]|nr:LamG domain-containing protein [Candidatus Paceibacterota bacterium]
WDADITARSRHPKGRWGGEMTVPLDAMDLAPGGRLFLNTVRRGGPTGGEPRWVPTGAPVKDITTDTPLGILTLDSDPGEVGDLPDDENLQTLRQRALVGWWRFDEENAADGTVARDSSGNNLHGEYKKWRHGRVERCPGIEGQALYSMMPEHTCFVEVPDQDSLDLKGPLTLEAWVRREAGGWAPYIAGKGYGEKFDGAYSLHLRNDATRMWFEVNGSEFEQREVKNTQSNPRDGNAIPIHVWTHLVAVWDGQEIALYINGRRHPWDERPSAQPDEKTGKEPEELKIRNSAEPFRIGTSAGCSPFPGAMDEIALYSRAFSPQEVYARFLEGCRTLGRDR